MVGPVNVCWMTIWYGRTRRCMLGDYMVWIIKSQMHAYITLPGPFSGPG